MFYSRHSKRKKNKFLYTKELELHDLIPRAIGVLHFIQSPLSFLFQESKRAGPLWPSLATWLDWSKGRYSILRLQIETLILLLGIDNLKGFNPRSLRFQKA